MNFLGASLAVNELASLLLLFACSARAERKDWKSGAPSLATEEPPALVQEPVLTFSYKTTPGWPQEHSRAPMLGHITPHKGHDAGSCKKDMWTSEHRATLKKGENLGSRKEPISCCQDHPAPREELLQMELH